MVLPRQKDGDWIVDVLLWQDYRVIKDALVEQGELSNNAPITLEGMRLDLVVASGDHQRMLTEAGIVCSMRRKGNYWDNAPAESFFATLITEPIHHERYRTREDARFAPGKYFLTGETSP